MTPTKEQIAERVQRIVALQLGWINDLAKVTPEASFAEDLGADSLDVVELVMAIEDEFGVEVPDTEAEKWKKVSDIHAFLQLDKLPA